ncbi:MAG: ATP-binding protein [Gammaproteobacteria bacterium]|nr:ATP-binding protein [Gammaproteobacteria bacterium]
MVDNTAHNPFAPGSGQLPPYLGGREDQQKALRRMLSYVAAGRTTPRDVVLIGPRGNGKTVLLRWFETAIGDEAPDVDVVWLTPSSIRNLNDLATELAPPHRFRRLLPSQLSVSTGVGKLGWEIGNEPKPLERLLVARCRARPLVVLLDEAHTLTKEIGQPLLNTSQRVRAEAPFLLVLSGTPGLWTHLYTMDASFWDRCECIGVGRLAPEASADVLAKPLAPAIVFEDAELQRVIEASQRYPFFLQLLGEALWDEAAPAGSTTIDAALVDRALGVFQQKRNTFYQIRYGEFGRSELLLSAAEAVAAAFRGRDSLTERQFNRVISDNMPPGTESEQSIAQADRLKALGFAWIPPGRMELEPGIPSLMEFVRNKAVG